MQPGFLGQLQTDFEFVCSADFSESATATDGVTTVTVPCLFDDASEQFDPDTQSKILYEGSRMTVSEASIDFNFRRGGILVTLRGKPYKIRANDWEYDGLGQLVIYLDPQIPGGVQSVNLTIANLVAGTNNVLQLPVLPKASTLKVFFGGELLLPNQFLDNRNGTFTILDPDLYPAGADVFVCDFSTF